MPTLQDLAAQLKRRDHSFEDFRRQIFDPQTVIGNYRADQLKRARESIVDFAQLLFPQYEPTWHQQVIGAHLEQLARGEIKRLVVLTPPRCGKTVWCSHLFPAWLLGRRDESVVSAAYNKTKASDEAQAVKTIFDDEAYQSVFPLAQIPRRTNEARREIRRAAHFNLVSRPRSVYRAAGIGSGLTGYNKTVGIIDDPIKSLEESYSERQRDKVWSWYSSVYRARDTRVLAGEEGVRDLLVMTPWHEDDLAGRILKYEQDDWHVLRLPAYLTESTFDERDDADHRKIDESLWPTQWPREELEKVRRTFPTTFQALFQCRPSDASTALFRRSQFLTYRAHDIPRDGFFQLSVDANFGTKGDTNSYVAVQLWCFTPNNRALLIRAWRGHWSFPETIAHIEAILAQYSMVDELLVEEKANGNAVMQTLSERVRFPIKGIRPRDSKMVRAIAIAPWVNSGAVLVPEEPSSWKEDFLVEVCAFPRGKANDQVDAMSQALLRLAQNPDKDLLQWGALLGFRGVA